MAEDAQDTDLNLTERLRKSFADGSLIQFVFDHAGELHGDKLEEAVSKIANLQNEGEIDIFNDAGWNSLCVGSDINYFDGQIVFCELIPRIDCCHIEIMSLVKKLVEAGDRDYTAGQPNAAFVKWCQEDLSRSESVVEGARNGDKLALEHLSLALTAGCYFDKAKEFLLRGCPSSKISGAVSLGEMNLDEEQALEAISLLEHAVIGCDDQLLLNRLFCSAFGVAEKSDAIGPQHLTTITTNAASHSFPEMLYSFARILWQNTELLNEDSLKTIFKALESVNPEHTGTLHQIDLAIPNLANAGHSDLTTELLASLVIKNAGTISIESFGRLLDVFRLPNSNRLSKTAATWLTIGDYSLCEGLCRLLGARTTSQVQIDIPKEHLPIGEEDQAFLCRKAVGFFFMAPITAASILVSVIRHSETPARTTAAELLFNPLLLSYGKNLREYLEELVSDDASSISDILREILDKKKSYLNGLAGTETLLELHPSEECRQIERLKLDASMRDSFEKAEKQSIMSTVFSKKYLLYGKSLFMSVEDPDGSQRPVDAKMGSHSFSVEYPMLDVVDCEGLQQMLTVFRAQRRKST